MRPPLAASSPRSRDLKKGRGPGEYGVRRRKDFSSFISDWASASRGVSGLFTAFLLSVLGFNSHQSISRSMSGAQNARAPFTNSRELGSITRQTWADRL